VRRFSPSLSLIVFFSPVRRSASTEKGGKKEQEKKGEKKKEKSERSFTRIALFTDAGRLATSHADIQKRKKKEKK